MRQKGKDKCMNGIFNLDSPLMSFLSKFADLMILNLLTLICCIPIVTIGASLTSMYYVLLRFHNEEVGSVIKDFFHSFKNNFKQATIMWVMYLLLIVALVEDYYLMFVVGLQTLLSLRYVVYVFTALVLISITWSFVLLSRYSNSIARMILNSFCVGVTHFVSTFVMVLLMLVPVAVILVFPAAFPIILIIGLSVVGYLQALLFSRVFKKLEQPQTESDASETDMPDSYDDDVTEATDSLASQLDDQDKE